MSWNISRSICETSDSHCRWDLRDNKSHLHPFETLDGTSGSFGSKRGTRLMNPPRMTVNNSTRVAVLRRGVFQSEGVQFEPRCAGLF